ncbi:uncharacterized protein LOC144916594 isoform X1 [Branchiostoma floridae x Branchiostoma belcheri]
MKVVKSAFPMSTRSMACQDSNSGPLGSESRTLSLRHTTPQIMTDASFLQVFGLLGWTVLSSVHSMFAWGGQHWVMFVLVTCWFSTLTLLILEKAEYFSNRKVNLVYAVTAALLHVIAAVVQCANADRWRSWTVLGVAVIYQRQAVAATFAVLTAIAYCVDAILTFKDRHIQVAVK